MKTNILNKIFIIFFLILILNLSIIIAADSTQQSTSETMDKWSAETLNLKIAEYHKKQDSDDFYMYYAQIRENSEKVNKVYDNLNADNKGKFWDPVVQKDDLYKAFESDTSKKNQRYKDLYDSVNKLNENGKFDKTNKLLESIGEEKNANQPVAKNYAQSLLTAITKNNPEFVLSKSITSFKLSQSKEGTIILTDNDNHDHNINLNLPKDVKKVLFANDKHVTDGKYAYYYNDKGNIKAAIKDGHQLTPPEEGSSKWNILDKDGKKIGTVDFGDDSDSIFRSTDERGVEIWGKGHKGGENKLSLEIDGVKYYPSPNSRRVGEGNVNYGSFKKLGDNVHEVEGISDNGKVKVDALYKKDGGVVIAYGDYDKKQFPDVDLNIYEKEGKSFINSIDGSALNDRVFFSVNEDSILQIGEKQFAIQSKNGETGYVYKIKDDQPYQTLDSVEEYANRQWEIYHSTTSSDGATQTRVGNGIDENTGQQNSHISEGAKGITNEKTEGAIELDEEGAKGTNFDVQGSKGIGDTGTKTETKTPPPKTPPVQKINPQSVLGNDFYNKGIIGEVIKPLSNNPNQVVAIKFGASWCGPCQKMNKEINANNLQGAYIDIDGDRYANLVQKYGISAYPTILYLKNGKVIGRSEGYTDINTINSWFSK